MFCVFFFFFFFLILLSVMGYSIGNMLEHKFFRFAGIGTNWRDSEMKNLLPTLP